MRTKLLTLCFDLMASLTMSAQDKFYSTLRGFIIAQLRKTTE